MDTVLFDFDGTIIDTNRIIREGLNHFARQTLERSLTGEEMHALYGRPLEEQMAFLDPVNPEDLTMAFRAWYGKMHDRMTGAFPGIPGLIRRLHADGVRLGIVTNNSREGTRMGLEHLGLVPYFPVVVTCDDVQHRKPAPDGIHLALDALGSAREDAIFVGDSANDLLAARQAGVASVLVGWTSLDPAQLLECRPRHIVHRPEHIGDLVETRRRRSA